ncbi:MAG: murein hydrolase activator EnvC family protein [Alphaproteobacteria bacterium]
MPRAIFADRDFLPACRAAVVVSVFLLEMIVAVVSGSVPARAEPVRGGTGSVSGDETAPAAAQLLSIEKALQEREQEHEKYQREAQSLSNDLAQVKEGLVKAAGAVQEQEDHLTQLEGKIAALESQRTGLRAALTRRGEQTTRVLMALERLAWRPTEALIAQPLAPAATVRTAILLRAAVPQIDASAHAVRKQLQDLAALRGQIAAHRDRIATVTTSLSLEHARLADLFDRKVHFQKEAEDRSRESARRVRELAREAGDLRDLMARLEEERRRRVAEERRLTEERRKAEEVRQAQERRLEEERRRLEEARIAEEQRLAAERLAAARTEAEQQLLREADERRREEGRRLLEERKQMAAASAKSARMKEQAATSGTAKPARPFSSVRGQLPMPARGRVITGFGQVNETGLASKGLSIRTRPGAQVIAPYDGVVVFSGPFRGYGQLLIIEHGEGYHTLLAGMARMDTEVGQHLVAGEPVGVVESDGEPTLYVELRREGQPINPLQWLTAHKGNNRG